MVLCFSGYHIGLQHSNILEHLLDKSQIFLNLDYNIQQLNIARSFTVGKLYEESLSFLLK